MKRIALLLDFCLIFLRINPLMMVTMTTTMMMMIPTPMHCIDISIANFLFLLMAMREMATVVMTTMMKKMMMTTTRTT
jgi:hypothetical protein